MWSYIDNDRGRGIDQVRSRNSYNLSIMKSPNCGPTARSSAIGTSGAHDVRAPPKPRRYVTKRVVRFEEL
jgi:hypothetical protein